MQWGFLGELHVRENHQAKLRDQVRGAEFERLIRMVIKGLYLLCQLQDSLALRVVD